MSTVDPIAALLADFERPAAARQEFAAALLSRLLAELTAPGPRRALIARPARLDRRRVLPRRGWRIAVAIALLLLLLAGIATATYVGLRQWVGSSPRGVQHVSSYRLTRVFGSPAARFVRY